MAPIFRQQESGHASGQDLHAILHCVDSMLQELTIGTMDDIAVKASECRELLKQVRSCIHDTPDSTIVPFQCTLTDAHRLDSGGTSIPHALLTKTSPSAVEPLYAENRSIERSEMLFEAIISNLPIAIFVKRASDRKYILCNKVASSLFGCPEEEIIGKSADELFQKEQSEHIYSMDTEAIEDKRTVEGPALALNSLCNGTRVWRVIRSPILNERGETEFLLSIGEDITGRKIAEDNLCQNERFLCAIFNGIEDGISVLDLDMNILRVNKKMEQVFANAMPLVGKKCYAAYHGRTEPCRHCPCVRTIREHSMQTDCLSVPHGDGSIVWLERSAFPLFDDNHQIKGVIEYVRDVTQKREYEQQLSHLAHHDTLTNLPNRLTFGDSLSRRTELAKRNGRSLAVLFIDLDRFKTINDTLGHDIGDQLLQHASSRLRFSVRDYDMVARMSGDEFTVILDRVTNRDEPENIAKRILHSLAEPFAIDGHEIFITASIGISMFPDDGAEPEDLVKNADIAMYRAKEEGKNNYQFYDRIIDDLFLSRTNMQNSLRKAIEHGELLVHYQPQLNVRAGSIEGIEALVRWQHPSLGLVMPDNFISIAEDIGIISDITKFVLFTACRQCKAWSDGGYPLTISVNISVRELHGGRLIETVSKALNATGLDPHRLILEITESALSKKPESAASTIQKLKSMGVRVSVDDFGTRYASLTLLKQFSVNHLKIDRYFVKNIEIGTDDTAIVEAVVAMAHKLGLQVIAEGVENLRQQEILKSLGCDSIQGYLLSRPVSAEEFEKLLRSHAQG